MSRHPSSQTWSIPPAARPALPGELRRTSLHRLASRPGRFEHHLTVLGRIGGAQIELATASEPLSFAHRNLSDEYVVALPTGDPELDAMPFLVLLGDPESGADLARLRHRAGDLVLHPDGYLHWPGRLRPPFELPRMPSRRAVLSFVLCASTPTPPADRPAWVAAGREADAKAYVDDAPPLLLDGLDGEPRALGRIGDVELALAAPPFAPARGGFVLVLEGDRATAWPGDLVLLPPGATWAGVGVARALVVRSDVHAPAPPPDVWHRVPEAPFPPFEDAERGSLPIEIGALSVTDADDASVEVRVAERRARVPRHWLARLLYRIALHTLVVDGARVERPRAGFGYAETYGGFFYDDHGGGHRLGLRGAAPVALEPSALAPTIERLYRAVAPDGYVERI